MWDGGPWRSRGPATASAGHPSLAEIRAGAEVEIVGVDRSAPGPVADRLRHLGFRQGVRVLKLRTAPLGDPAVYRLLGYDTCLRRQEAAYIEVAG
ncbi:MAG: ferrous iron transport protein A [Mycobacterium sp.]|jgi:ferrous iron transport protein A|nr:MAG: ferrous iron transport protein A [Mycobacterium sp.]